jgi:hypothetical protein
MGRIGVREADILALRYRMGIREDRIWIGGWEEEMGRQTCLYGRIFRLFGRDR